MDFSNHISPGLILPRLSVAGWGEVWAHLRAAVEADPLYAQEAGSSVDATSGRALQASRQNLLSIADKGALLHDCRPRVQGIVFALARLETPLALPDEPASKAEIVLYILSGPHRASWALKMAGHFRDLLLGGGLEKALTESTPTATHQWLDGLNLRLDAPLFARDIMRPPFFEVLADTPVPEVTLQMHKHRSNAVAVVDSEQRIIGEITSNRLFKLGIPEFFERLASVSFIREFDPFEHYYTETGNALARDVMTSDFTVIEENATVMEIVFALTVQNHRKLYVVRDGRRIGVIDRVEIVDKILNF